MQPIFGQWNGFTISTYAVWMTSGLIAATIVSLGAAQRQRIRSAFVLDAILAAIVVGVIAARAGYVIINWGYYQDHIAEIARLWQGGLNWQAGLIGGSSGAWFIARRHAPPLTLLDLLAVGLPLGIACGWIGSYLSATAYGAELFPGDRFFFLARDLPDWYGLSNPRWPTQLIGAAWSMILFLTLWFTRKKDGAVGTRYWLMVTAYSVGALLIGFTRGDEVPRFYGWRVDQLLDALLVVAGAIGLWRVQRIGKQSMAEQLMAESSNHDQRIAQYIKATEQLKQGQFDLEVPASPLDEVGRLGQALRELARVLELRYREMQKIEKITTQINAGVLLDDILEIVYRDFRELIPYNRIGLSLIEEDGQTVRARWMKTDQPHITITAGYSSPLAGSSLEEIIRTGQPRILNDLEEYLRHKPSSTSTRDIMGEGIRSSLTCPLIANGVPIGFIFFSSVSANTYSEMHVNTFQHVAEQLSIIVEKGRLVSEIAAQKAAIEQQNEELRHLNELKDSFLGMAAHDLRTPLSVIQLAVSLMLDYSMPLSDEERIPFLQDIKRQGDHMLALLNDLLDVTEIEAGHLSLTRQPIDLADFLQDATAWHRKLAAPKGTQIILEDIPAGSAHADALRLRQVVDNLISNAVKYSPPGSQVRVRAERTPTGWRIHVKDQGPGITSKDRQKMFQDFARLSAKPTGGEKSTGLGLAITRRVVESHGGQIGVDSEPGQGADFWFTLPDDVPAA